MDFKGFGSYLADELFSFVKEKGLVEEFMAWNKSRHKQEMREQAFIDNKGLGSEFWSWKRDLVRKNQDGSRRDFLKEKGLLGQMNHVEAIY